MASSRRCVPVHSDDHRAIGHNNALHGTALRQAHTALASAGNEPDPHRRRELASVAVSLAHQAAGNGGLTDLERAQAREVIGNGRKVLSSGTRARMRQQNIEREHEHEHESPGIAL